MKLWLAHPTGNTFVRALLRELARGGHDFDFFTTIGFPSHPFLPRRRSYEVARSRMHCRPARELGRLLGLNISVDDVYHDLDRAVATRLHQKSCATPERVYAYEDGARETFATAAELGIEKFYDLPIAYWKTTRQLLDEEAERLPEWEPTLLSTRDSQEKLERKEQELALADCVICPSEFVYDSLPAEVRLQKRCILSPFGSPTPPPFPRAKPGPKLRLLFAGSMSQRKGLADVFAAMHLLNRNDVELCVMGTPLLPQSFYRAQFPDFIYESTRSHEDVLKLMLSCDVLVLPSIVEGRALVQQEALACGLPVIVTRNAGGEDLVDEGRTGFLVPMRSPASIAEKIQWFAESREHLEDMRHDCERKAAEYSWSDYAKRILDPLNDSVCA
jgi:glycosyltransferase involved in cell wall biosynthesis